MKPLIEFFQDFLSHMKTKSNEEKLTYLNLGDELLDTPVVFREVKKYYDLVFSLVHVLVWDY